MKNLLTIFWILILMFSFRASTYKSFCMTIETSSLIVVPDNFTTIQSAIDAAPEGATIYVKNGTYNESLTITKTLTILGSEEAPTIIKSPVNSDVVYIRANNLTFARFRIEGALESFGSGIHLTQSQNCRILNTTVVNNRYGIYIWDSFNITLKYNEMVNNNFNFGVWGLVLNHFLHEIDTSNLVDGKPVYFLINENNKNISKEAGYIALINSTNILVKDLNVTHNYQGVVVAYSTSITIQNLTISNNYYGIHLVASNRNLIRLNSVEWNSVGILFDLSSYNDISENNLSDNGIGLQFSYSPLLPQRCVENLIHENNITNNEDGIQVLGALNNTFYGNKISAHTRYGILSIDSSSNIFCGNIFYQNNLGIVLNHGGNSIFFNNNFINNTVPVHIENSINWWNSTLSIGGNYWSNLFITDVDMDGLADLPYHISNGNVDEHPLAGIFYNYTIIWNSCEYSITFVCNSSVGFLEFFPSENRISIEFIGPEGTLGFGRMNIPKKLLETLWGGNLTILIDGCSPFITRKWEDNSYIYIYLVYLHPISQVALIPELSSKLLLLLSTSLILLRIFIKKQFFYKKNA